MVEEEAVGGVERSNLLHFFSIKFEVEEIQILLHSFLVNGLRDDDYVALQQPAQGYLSGSLAVFLANLGEGRVGEQSVLFFIIVKSYSCYLSCYIPHRSQPPATRWRCSRQVFQRRGEQTSCLLQHRANASRWQEYG